MVTVLPIRARAVYKLDMIGRTAGEIVTMKDK
jgi:hypothetical protein